MNTSQTSTSNNCDHKLYLDDKEISFLLTIVEKSKNIHFIGQSKLKEIYEDIDYAILNRIEFNYVETAKNINTVHKTIEEYEDMEDEVSEGITLGYITKKDHPKSFEKLLQYHKLYLDDKEISFLLIIVEKSKNIHFIGQSKLKEIYEDIDYAILNRVEFNYVETAKNINTVHKTIEEYEDMEDEVSEGITLGYITKKDHPKSFEKLLQYRTFLEELKRLKNINIIEST